MSQAVDATTTLDTLVISAGSYGGYSFSGITSYSVGWSWYGVGANSFYTISSLYSSIFGQAHAWDLYMISLDSFDFLAQYVHDLTLLAHDLYTFNAETLANSIIMYTNMDILAETNDIIPLQVYMRSDELSSEYDSGDHSFSGSSFTPLAALGHYLYGGGETMSVDLHNLGLEIEASEITPLNSLIEDSNSNSQTVSGTFAYSTYKDSLIHGAWLGGITLKVDGYFSRTSETEWNFVGDITGLPDQYDVNENADRGAIADFSTDMLELIGAIGGGDEYQIDLDGTIHVELNNNVLIYDEYGL
ncbi:lipid II-degrading bacteriocin [Roseibium algae]|uniref:Lipid II-degrading bacteriocin n=1 Tax=Roseibium algae TaxID=3123038 RepID=A0ABU8TSC7_9HYPH